MSPKKIGRRIFLKYLIAVGVAAGATALGLYGVSQIGPEDPEIDVIENFNSAYISDGEVKGTNVIISSPVKETENDVQFPKLSISSSIQDPNNKGLQMELVQPADVRIEFSRKKRSYRFFSFYFQIQQGDFYFPLIVNNGHPVNPTSIYSSPGAPANVFEYSLEKYNTEDLDMRLLILSKTHYSKGILDYLIFSKDPRYQ